MTLANYFDNFFNQPSNQQETLVRWAIQQHHKLPIDCTVVAEDSYTGSPKFKVVMGKVFEEDVGVFSVKISSESSWSVLAQILQQVGVQ